MNIEEKTIKFFEDLKCTEEAMCRVDRKKLDLIRIAGEIKSQLYKIGR